MTDSTHTLDATTRSSNSTPDAETDTTRGITAQTVQRPPVSTRYIWFLALATFGGYIALIAPIGISLSIRVQELAPDNVEVLGYVIGSGALIAAISSPLLGMWSDRTRTRLGRRRPFGIGGAILGLVSLGMIGGAPSLPMVVAGWMLTQLGWTAALNSLMLSQADLLPEEQRGKVSGLGAFVQMVASVTGVGIASAFIGHNHLMFLVPGVIGVALMLAWVISVKEPSSLDMVLGPKLTVRRALSNMVFNPAKYPDFAWNWLGRLIFMFGVTLGTTFTTLFFASRLSTSGQVADIGGLIVILSLAGVVATGGGALLGGMLSDKFHRRRVLVLASGAGFTLGAIIMALGGTSAPILIVGSIISSLALGVFSAVNQAMVLDVLPQRDTEAGRFIGINVYSTSLAQAIAPVVAAPLLLVGMSGSDKNYTLLLLVAAACTAIGAVIVMVFVRSSK